MLADELRAALIIFTLTYGRPPMTGILAHRPYSRASGMSIDIPRDYCCDRRTTWRRGR
jgi:hypothetical protein